MSGEWLGRPTSVSYVRKVIVDSGTVASDTMGVQRKTPMPVELHWIGYLVNSIGLSA